MLASPRVQGGESDGSGRWVRALPFPALVTHGPPPPPRPEKTTCCLHSLSGIYCGRSSQIAKTPHITPEASTWKPIRLTAAHPMPDPSLHTEGSLLNLSVLTHSGPASHLSLSCPGLSCPSNEPPSQTDSSEWPW